MSDPAFTSLVDQTLSAVEDVAKIAGKLRRQLRAEGFSRSQAKQIALRWLRRTVDAMSSTATDAGK